MTSPGIQIPARWMPPETLRTGRSTVASDIWSFGVLAWEMMTLGQLPHEDCDDWVEMMRRGEAGEQLQRPPDCPADLYASIMQRCWILDPAARVSFPDLKMSLLTALGELGDDGRKENKSPPGRVERADGVAPTSPMNSYRTRSQQDTDAESTMGEPIQQTKQVGRVPGCWSGGRGVTGVQGRGRDVAGQVMHIGMHAELTSEDTHRNPAVVKVLSLPKNVSIGDGSPPPAFRGVPSGKYQDGSIEARGSETDGETERLLAHWASTNITSAEAEKYLRATGQGKGAFCLRKSSSDDGTILHIWTGSRVAAFKITHKKVGVFDHAPIMKYVVTSVDGERTFSTLTSLVAHYSDTSRLGVFLGKCIPFPSNIQGSDA